MTKFGIGVGEEFPVDDAAPRGPQGSQDARGDHRHGLRHRLFHGVRRLTFLALLVSAIVWLLRSLDVAGPHGPYAFHPGPHHVFFPVLLIVLLVAAAWRHHRHHHHHWHDHHHRGRGEGA